MVGLRQSRSTSWGLALGKAKSGTLPASQPTRHLGAALKARDGLAFHVREDADRRRGQGGSTQVFVMMGRCGAGQAEPRG